MPSLHNGIEVPDLTDPPNSPAQMRALVDSGGAVPRFPTLAAARTAYPAGQRPAGMLVGVGTRLYTSNGTDFVSVSAGGVEVFATEAERAAAITNPAVGQLTVISLWPTALWAWTGTRWQPTVQSGEGTVTTNSSGGYTKTFPIPFIGAPVVIITDKFSTSSRLLVHGLIADQVLTTGFGAVIRGVSSGTPFDNQTTRFNWLAIARTV